MNEMKKLAQDLRQAGDVVDQLDRDRDDLIAENGRLKAVVSAAEIIMDLGMDAAGDDWDTLEMALSATDEDSRGGVG